MIKRVLILLLIAPILTLCSCSGSGHTLDTAYSGEIRMTDGRADYTADLDQSDDVLTVTMTSPASVAGLSYTFRGDETHISLNGLTCISSAKSLPSTSCIALLKDVLENADHADFISEEDGTETYSVKTGTRPATVTAENGKPKTITSDNGSLEIIFSD